MLQGCFTALVTPFSEDGVDYDGLTRLVEFQVTNGVTGILAVGTTGESPALSWDEHNAVIEHIARQVKGRCKCIAGTGSNNTAEALAATHHAAEDGVDAVLLVDPYYNGPSSLEIRREYLGPVAAAFPDMPIIPYVIPGRTGTQLFPEDLGLLSRDYPNVRTVKEATADLDNMKRTRTCCGPDFSILSGDDGMTFSMMTDPAIAGGGVISVASNVIPDAVSRMVSLLREGKADEAEALNRALSPLFGLVAVKTTETSPLGEVTFKARNPLPIKTLMSVLGMPVGPCRRPLGRMTPKALDVVLEAGRSVFQAAPEVFAPIESFFGVDVEARLNMPTSWEGLAYSDY
jgi:4-hydroxy-tetrahydrodipicolinate synthase